MPNSEEAWLLVIDLSDLASLAQLSAAGREFRTFVENFAHHRCRGIFQNAATKPPERTTSWLRLLNSVVEHAECRAGESCLFTDGQLTVSACAGMGSGSYGGNMSRNLQVSGWVPLRNWLTYGLSATEHGKRVARQVRSLRATAFTRPEKVITAEEQVIGVVSLFPATTGGSVGQQIDDIEGYLDARNRCGSVPLGNTHTKQVGAIIVTAKQLCQLSQRLAPTGAAGAAESVSVSGQPRHVAAAAAAIGTGAEGVAAGRPQPQLWALVLWQPDAQRSVAI
jgi:hypothetical protein